jgi:hypothetical protein
MNGERQKSPSESAEGAQQNQVLMRKPRETSGSPTLSHSPGALIRALNQAKSSVGPTGQPVAERTIPTPYRSALQRRSSRIQAASVTSIQNAHDPDRLRGPTKVQPAPQARGIDATCLQEGDDIRSTVTAAAKSFVAQRMDDPRGKYYSALGVGVNDRPLPIPESVSLLCELVPVEGEKTPEKRHINELLGTLLALGQSNRPDIITGGAIKLAQEKLVKLVGAGYGDYGANCRAKAPGVVDLAFDRGYDIRSETVLKLLRDILVEMESISYRTQMGAYKGSWRGGGFE